MVLREGAETVLILSAVSLNSTELMSFLGTLLRNFRRGFVWSDVR